MVLKNFIVVVSTVVMLMIITFLGVESNIKYAADSEGIEYESEYEVDFADEAESI